MTKSFCSATQRLCRGTVGICCVTKVISRKICLHHTATFILTHEGQSERIFSSIGFPEIVEYLSACNAAKYCTLALH